MKRIFKFALIAIFTTAMFSSCTEDDVTKVAPIVENGFYVVNEGTEIGSISYIDKSYNTTQDYFKLVNEKPLGKFTQSMYFSKDYAMIVVTNSGGGGYVNIVNKETFKYIGSIKDLSYPRELTVANNKIYISNGKGTGADNKKVLNSILVYNLDTFKKTGEITVGAGPEKIIKSGDRLYVANSGGWSNDDNTVSVIDINSDEVTETYKVKNCPKDMCLDANNNLWVLCKGTPDFSKYPDVTYTESGLSKINTKTGEVTNFDLDKIGGIGVKSITASRDKKTIYYMSDAVYAMDINDSELPKEKFLKQTYNGIDINPSTGYIYLAESKGTNNGNIVIYDSSANLIKTVEVGIMPNASYFK